MNSLAMATEIKSIIDDKLGEDIVCIDLRGISSVTDYFIIATGKVDTHVKSISNYIMDEMKKKFKERPLAAEGISFGRWSCIDYGEVIIHIMLSEEREIYDLQSIWGGAPVV